MSDPTDPPDLLTAYADGELGPEDRAAVEAALAERPELRAQLEDIRALQSALGGLPAAPLALREPAWKRLRQRAQLAWTRPAPARTWVQRLRWYAAAALLVIVFGGMLLPSVSLVRESARKARYPNASAQTDEFKPSSGYERAESELQNQTAADYLRRESRSAEVIDRLVAGGRQTGPQAGNQPAASPRPDGSIATGTFYGFADANTACGIASGNTWKAKDGWAVPVEGANKSDQPSPVTPLNLPEADTAKEEESSAVRDQGDPDVAGGEKGAFMAIGAGGGSAGFFGNRSGAARKRALAQYDVTLDDDKDGTGREPNAPATTPPVPPGASFPGPTLEVAEPNGSTTTTATAIPADKRDEVAAQTRLPAKSPSKPAAQPQRPAIPQLPAQAPAMLAVQMANIAPTPLLAGDADGRLRNLVDAYQLPLLIPAEAGRQLWRLAPLPHAPGLSAGQQVVMMANRAGLQVVAGNGRLTLNAQPALLDPTDRFGLDAAAFTAALGTPPMALVAHDARQTFALDADTASFARARAELQRGELPDPAAVRPEHFINAVPADYPTPTGHEAFALYAEAGPAPFARGPLAARSAVVAVGVVGRAAGQDERRALRLVFAIDASGSMARPGGLDRARLAIDGLVGRLDPSDRVAVVAFGERGRVITPATAEQGAIRAALDRVVPNGATNTAEGLALACQVGREMASSGAELRVVLVTDGAAIAGPDEAAARERVASLKAVGGSLLILGVGERVVDTRALDELAKAGDGQQIFLGSDDEARDVVGNALLPERLAMLARDAKAQVTWNPERVTYARLVGYERRRLDHAAFRDDRVDAGEIPSATVVTALFEVVLADGGSGPLGTAAVRYFDTRLESVRELACPMPGAILAPVASPRLRTLACAAELAEQLRGSWWANVRPTPFRVIAAACAGLPAPADQLAAMAEQAERLRPMIEVRP